MEVAECRCANVCEGSGTLHVKGVGTEVQDMSVAIERSIVSMGTAVSHPDKVGAKVDVGCHDGIKAGLALVDQLGEGGPVVGVADHKALLAVVLATGAYTEINSDLMLAVAPLSCSVDGGLGDCGQGDGGCQFRHGPSCPVAPSPDTGNDTPHTVIDVISFIG